MSAVVLMLLEQAIWLPLTYAIAAVWTGHAVLYLVCMPLFGLVGLLLKKFNRLFAVLIAVAASAALAFFMEGNPGHIQFSYFAIISRLIIGVSGLFLIHEGCSNTDGSGETAMYPPLIMVLLNPVIYHFFKSAAPPENLISVASIVISAMASLTMTAVSQANRFRRYGKRVLRLTRSPLRNTAVFTAFAAMLIFTLAAVLTRFIHLKRPMLTSGSLSSKTVTQSVVSAASASIPENAAEQQPNTLAFSWIVPLIKALIFIAAAYAVLKIIYFIYKKTVSLFRQKRPLNEIDYYGFTDKTENTFLNHSRMFLRRMRENKRGPGWDGLQSETERLRFLFRSYQRMAENSGISVPASGTPRENCRRIKASINGRLPEPGNLAELYDKARYGDIPPTHGDVMRLKQRILP